MCVGEPTHVQVGDGGVRRSGGVPRGEPGQRDGVGPAELLRVGSWPYRWQPHPSLGLCSAVRFVRRRGAGAAAL
eukprot:4854403-Prymnesium_polylepis.1